MILIKNQNFLIKIHPNHSHRHQQDITLSKSVHPTSADLVSGQHQSRFSVNFITPLFLLLILLLLGYFVLIVIYHCVWQSMCWIQRLCSMMTNGHLCQTNQCAVVTFFNILLFWFHFICPINLYVYLEGICRDCYPHFDVAFSSSSFFFDNVRSAIAITVVTMQFPIAVFHSEGEKKNEEEKCGRKNHVFWLYHNVRILRCTPYLCICMYELEYMYGINMSRKWLMVFLASSSGIVLYYCETG